MPHQLGDIWVKPEENEKVSTVTISARSEIPEQGGCLACSMRYREMPVDRAQWTIRGLLAVRSERHIGSVLRAMAMDFHPECYGKLQEASWTDSLEVAFWLPNGNWAVGGKGRSRIRIQPSNNGSLEPSCHGQAGEKLLCYGYMSKKVQVGFSHGLSLRYGMWIWISEKRSSLKTQILARSVDRCGFNPEDFMSLPKE